MLEPPHSTQEQADVGFRVYRAFNQPRLREQASQKRRLHTFDPSLFPSESLPDRLARSLARHRVVHLKELLESFEFFARVYRRMRRPHMVDLCAGHGLVGILFAICERQVERVTLMDERIPETYGQIRQAVLELAPWVEDKLHYVQAPLDDALRLPAGAGTLIVHACGPLTDVGLSRALQTGGPVALMPCCYGKAEPALVPGLKRALGKPMASDIARSYRLHEAGYQVDWSAIPRAITPMNRIMVGWNRSPAKDTSCRD